MYIITFDFIQSLIRVKLFIMQIEYAPILQYNLAMYYNLNHNFCNRIDIWPCTLIMMWKHNKYTHKNILMNIYKL